MHGAPAKTCSRTTATAASLPGAVQENDGVLEREFTLGEISGFLWTPGSTPAPPFLSGHNDGLHQRLPRLVARARHYPADYGFAVATIDALGHCDRPRSVADEQARADLRGTRDRPDPLRTADRLVFQVYVRCIRWPGAELGLSHVQPGDRPADQHPLDLARALEDGEDSELRGSFRSSAACRPRGISTDPARAVREE
jgi:hypothetical protein